jgi:hypothetical protein
MGNVQIPSADISFADSVFKDVSCTEASQCKTDYSVDCAIDDLPIGREGVVELRAAARLAEPHSKLSINVINWPP